jgi:CheY-like chemotaxis protein
MKEILLAEDNPADVYLIRETLREHGVEAQVRVASDGREVLKLICPDGSAELAEVPVVVLTSSDSPRDQKVANQLGAACYLRKPSSLEQFLALGGVLKTLLDGTYTNSASK